MRQTASTVGAGLRQRVVEARLRERATELSVAVSQAVRRWMLRLRERWGRSLQLRVVTATFVLSAVVVSVLGYFLMQRVVADLYASKQHSADERRPGRHEHRPHVRYLQGVTELGHQI